MNNKENTYESEEFKEGVSKLADKIETTHKEDSDNYTESMKTLNKISESLDEIEKGLEELVETTEGVLHGIEERLYITKASLPKDYNKIKRIQKEGYGKVHWRLMDMLLYRLAGSKEYIVHAYGQEVGFLHIRSVNKDSLHILNYCFLPDYQNKGIGTKALNKIKRKANEDGYLYITLNVRERNHQAINMYKNNGFIETGRDKGYYKDTKEDALRMTYGVKKDCDD